jgi:hypothetical protein
VDVQARERDVDPRKENPMTYGYGATVIDWIEQAEERL